MKSYAETTDWLFSQFPAYQNLGAGAYKPDLHNISKLLSTLGNPQDSLKFIHIAGTNGKGSTSHIISSILQAHGLKTGLFTSPHLVDFRERIKINGEYISENEVVLWVNDVLPELNLDYSPSFFELSFAMAIDYFAKQECQICVIETGLGGRLDATNILQPLISVITNIGLDHKQFLGNTRGEVAREKTGIIKANTPVIICEKDDETQSIFENTAKNVNAPLLWVENDTEIETDLYGSFQQLNVNTAVCTINHVAPLLGFNLDQKLTEKGLKSVKTSTNFKGRMEVLSEQPLTILDGAHNTEGVRALLSSIDFTSGGKLYLIYGASSDKDISEITTLFPEKAEVLFTTFNHPRSFTIEKLKEHTDELKQKTSFHPSPHEALKQAQQIANKEDTILIFGSLFLVADFF